MRKSIIALYAATIIGVTACNVTPTPPSVPTPTASAEPELTALQQHIKEDAIKEVNEHPLSKQGVIDYLAKEYPVEDVKAGVAGMACETDWITEAAEAGRSYGITDKA